MDAMALKEFKAVQAFLYFAILFLLMGTPAHGRELYTRTDELSCGNTLVQAFTTCTAESEEYPWCTEQHFLFRNKTTGAFTRVEASREPVVGRDREGGRIGIWLSMVAARWACLRGKSQSYVVIDYGGSGVCDYCWRDEIFDLNGRKLASQKRTDSTTNDTVTRFARKWRSLGLPPYPWPLDEFVSIRLIKTDRR
jgi:hypothetical protein